MLASLNRAPRAHGTQVPKRSCHLDLLRAATIWPVWVAGLPDRPQPRSDRFFAHRQVGRARVLLSLSNTPFDASRRAQNFSGDSCLSNMALFSCCPRFSCWGRGSILLRGGKDQYSTSRPMGAPAHARPKRESGGSKLVCVSGQSAFGSPYSFGLARRRPRSWNPGHLSRQSGGVGEAARHLAVSIFKF